MLAILSPAKSLDFENPSVTEKFTKPNFVDESSVLVKQLRQLSEQEIGDLMSISENLSSLNKERYESWKPEFEPNEAKQAVLAFKGDVYQGLEADQLSEGDLLYAQEHLRILSGLYGLLRPLDLIHPYRLEMGTKLKVNGYSNLYDFWGSQLTEALNKAMEQANTSTLVNLASNEYFKAVKPKGINGEIITPVFKDEKNGKLKVISFYAKKARGQMARYLIENKIDTVDGLKGFNEGGYAYQEGLGKKGELVFAR